MNELTPSAVESAVSSVQGNLSWAAQLLETSREKLLVFLACNPELQTHMEDLRGAIVDDANLLLDEGVADQQPWAIKRTLRTYGTSRGYGKKPIERDQYLLPTTTPLLERLNDEQRRRFDELNKKAEMTEDPAPPPPDPDDAESGEVAPYVAPPDMPPEAEIADALTKSRCHFANVAKTVGLRRSQLLQHVRHTYRLRLVVYGLHEEKVDHAESALRMKLNKKERWSIEFVLDTIGRHLSYPAELLDTGQGWLHPPKRRDLKKLDDDEINELCELWRIIEGRERPAWEVEDEEYEEEEYEEELKEEVDEEAEMAELMGRVNGRAAPEDEEEAEMEDS